MASTPPRRLTSILLSEWDRNSSSTKSEDLDEKLEKFLDDFSDNATSWKDATDELPDMLSYMEELLGSESPPTSYKSPASWNRNYKKRIRWVFPRLNNEKRKIFKERFHHWLYGSEE